MLVWKLCWLLGNTSTKSRKSETWVKTHRKKWKTWNVVKKQPSHIMGKENVALAWDNLVPKTKKCLVKNTLYAEESSGLEVNKRRFCWNFFLKRRARNQKKKTWGLWLYEEVLWEAKYQQCYKIIKAIPKNHSMGKQFRFSLSSEPYINQKGKQKGLSQRLASGHLAWFYSALFSREHHEGL